MGDQVRMVKGYFDTLKETMDRVDKDSVSEVIDVLMRCYDDESSIFICGNGGSGATASHIVCDFNKGISMHHDKKFRMFSLNDNMSIITAIANDCRYEDIFRMQVEGKVKRGDVLVAISGSGNSKNVISVAEYFKGQGNTVISLTGYDGGALKPLGDHSIHVPIKDMQKVEDIHMMILHLMSQIIAEKLGHPMC